MLINNASLKSNVRPRMFQSALVYQQINPLHFTLKPWTLGLVSILCHVVDFAACFCVSLSFGPTEEKATIWYNMQYRSNSSLHTTIY